MKKLLLLFTVLAAYCFHAQDYLGFVNSNYAGITGAQINPANIVDSRMRVDVNLIGLNFNMANNYLGLKREAIKFNAETSAFEDSLFRKKYVVDINNGKDKAFFFSTRVSLPSFMFSIGKKHAVGFSFNSRTYMNIDGISENLAKLLYSDIGRDQDYQVEDLLGINIQNKFFSANAMTWLEYGLTYAYVVKDSKQHFLKAGITPKLLKGFASAYMNVTDFEFRFDNDPLRINNDSLQVLTVLRTDVNYAHSDNLDDLGATRSGRVFSNFGYTGFGMDLGVVYEWRPNYLDYLYDMDGKTGLWMRNKNKYKLKVGASLLDFGSIKYDKGQYSNDFVIEVDTLQYRLLELEEEPVYDFDRIIDSLATYKNTPDFYRMSLPTALSFQIDYNIHKNFYVNLTPYFSFQRKNRASKVHDITVISIAPRWDHQWFGFSLPISYNSFYAKANQPIKVGAMLRLGPIIVGTNDLASYTAGNLFGANFYFLLKVPIPYGRVRDRDKDGISNREDRCKDVPGVWEFLGCPDRDSDHIQDAEDRCPDVAGPKEFGGCPDTDNDGIQDSEDACPNDKGLKHFQGCPDTDGDNIPDKDDECPFEAGSPEFKGCPDTDADGTLDKEDNCPTDFGPKEFQGCPDRDADSIIDREDSCPDQFGPRDNNGCPWPDADNDGVFDKDDECPQVAGVAELKGCPAFAPSAPAGPVTQTVAMKVAEKKIIEKAFATLEFAPAKDVIKPKSLAALNELAKLLIAHSVDWKIKLSGHTDNVGSPEKNMELSEKRANAVKNYLVKRGVSEEQVITEWFGQTKPIAENTTAKGKQKNRRVEMKIMSKE